MLVLVSELSASAVYIRAASRWAGGRAFGQQTEISCSNPHRDIALP